MIIKKQEAIGVLQKFEMPPKGGGKELIARFYYNSNLCLCARVPKGRGDLQCTGKFRKSLYLDEIQLKEAISCPFKKEHFIDNLREKGLIA
jgi:hypothetical protein